MRHLGLVVLAATACTTTSPPEYEPYVPSPSPPPPSEKLEVVAEVVEVPQPEQPALPGPRLVLQAEHTDRIVAIRLVRDDTLVFTAGADGALKLRDFEGRLVWEHHVGLDLSDADLSADGLTFGLVTRDGRAFVLKLGGERIFLAGPKPHVTAVALSDGEDIVTANLDGRVYRWSPTGERIAEVFAANESVWTLAISRDGRVVAAGDDGGTVWLRNGDDAPVEVSAHRSEVTVVAIDATGTQWASASEGRPDPQSANGSAGTHVKLWHAQERVASLPSSGATSVRFSADTRTVVVSQSGFISVWRDGFEQALQPAGGPPRLVDVSADGSVVVSASTDLRLVESWSSGRRQDLTLFEPAWTTSLAFGVDGRLVAGGWDQRARIWSPDGVLIGVTRPHGGTVDAVEVSPDGRFVATGSESVWLWTRDGDPVQSLHATTNHAGAVAFSSDSKRVFSGDGEGKMFIWRAQPPERIRIFKGHRDRVYAIAVSPDGERVVSGAPYGELKLWRNDFRKHQLLTGHGDYGFVYDVDWAPDGKRFASAGGGVVRVWDRNGTAVETIDNSRHRQSNVGGVAISVDGAIAISTESDIRIWRGGEQQRVLSGHTNTVYALAWSPDGRVLASGGREGALRLWCVATGESVELFARTRATQQGVVSDWVAIATDGAFAASPDAGDLLVWADGFAIIEGSAADRARPDAVQKVLGCGAEQGPLRIRAAPATQRGLRR